jgi:hypothetical protein
VILEYGSGSVDHDEGHDCDQELCLGWVTDLGAMETYSFASSKALEIPVSVRMFVISASSSVESCGC